VSLEEALGYRFADPRLLEHALTHPSRSREEDGSRGNERLEFLGDAVLDVAVAHALFESHPDWAEGDLTRARAGLVNTRALALRARALELGEYARLGRTEQKGGGARKDSVLANVFEAVLAAVYLDGGLDAARALVERLFADDLATPSLERDPKTHFQEWAHAQLRMTPHYEAVGDSGDEEDPERFTAAVRVGDAEHGRGSGRTKREAERAAAREALDRVGE